MAIKSIQIGSVTVFKRLDPWTCRPDDRQERHETMGGIHVEDYGFCLSGEIYSSKFRFTRDDWETVKGYWTTRTKVDVVTEADITLESRRVVVKSYTQVDRFPDYIEAEIEFWAK